MDKKVLVQRLDRMVSILVRRGEDRCATCGKKLLWRYRQAGHFVPRVVQRTRWDFNNVHVQCARCNVELDGNLKKYAEFIRQTYGDNTLADLVATYDAYKHGALKPMSTEEMNELYRVLYDEIARRYPADLSSGWEKP